ncbi:MAG: ABC transporter ATP-binding protein [Treponema sp.]|jgi:branched-chain amino acid transport system ATP-binding protein|nr:ABC transporter ATP-binding protein [Treponema sp.]
MCALLKIDHLTHRFGGLQALTDINVELEEHQIAGLIGPNGAGKTTVFNLVSGFYIPSEGNIIFNGTRLNGKKSHDIAALGIGRTFQNIRLWNEMTVLDNISIAQHYKLGYGVADAFFQTKKYQTAEKNIKDESMALLEKFGLADHADDYPDNLPYGVQRRVEICRALSLHPKLLLLDEPAAGLSTSDVAGLIDHVNWIHENFDTTIWMIEHQMEVIMKLCSFIQVVDFGKEIARGTPNDIKTNPAVIKAYLGDEQI